MSSLSYIWDSDLSWFSLISIVSADCVTHVSWKISSDHIQMMLPDADQSLVKWSDIVVYIEQGYKLRNKPLNWRTGRLTYNGGKLVMSSAYRVTILISTSWRDGFRSVKTSTSSPLNLLDLLPRAPKPTHVDNISSLPMWTSVDRQEQASSIHFVEVLPLPARTLLESVSTLAFPVLRSSHVMRMFHYELLLSASIIL